MKHLKKDDGYVLIYVLIVFTILSFVAVSICTTALNNLKAQKADVARMEARYEAEGYLQQFIAEVEALEIKMQNTTADGVKNAVATAFWDGVISHGVTGVTFDAFETTPPPSTKEIEITATAEKSNYIATITVKAELFADIDAVAKEPFDSENPQYEGSCSLKENGWKYVSYDISYEEVPNETE